MGIRDGFFLTYIGSTGFFGISVDSDHYQYSNKTVRKGLTLLKFIKRN